MVCAGTQPTLPATERDLTHYAQSLGLMRLAAWYALERSASVEAPLSTGTALTQMLFRLLESAGVLRVPEAAEPGARRSLYEPLAWCYPAELGAPRELQSILHVALQELAARPDAIDGRLELWETLASAEIETYLGHLLRRHTLDASGAGHVVHLMAGEWAGHCLARKRYLAWFGARGAAAALLRSGMDQEVARNAMLEEMRRRSRWLTARAAANALPKEDYCFVPGPQWKRPLLLEVFLTTVFPVGHAYWAELPQEYR